MAFSTDTMPRPLIVSRIERLAFFNMESQLHLAFQPHRMLTLVYTLDAFASTTGTRTRSLARSTCTSVPKFVSGRME